MTYYRLVEEIDEELKKIARNKSKDDGRTTEKHLQFLQEDFSVWIVKEFVSAKLKGG